MTTKKQKKPARDWKKASQPEIVEADDAKLAKQGMQTPPRFVQPVEFTITTPSTVQVDKKLAHLFRHRAPGFAFLWAQKLQFLRTVYTVSGLREKFRREGLSANLITEIMNARVRPVWRTLEVVDRLYEEAFAAVITRLNARLRAINVYDFRRQRPKNSGTIPERSRHHARSSPNQIHQCLEPVQRVQVTHGTAQAQGAPCPDQRKRAESPSVSTENQLTSPPLSGAHSPVRFAISSGVKPPDFAGAAARNQSRLRHVRFVMTVWPPSEKGCEPQRDASVDMTTPDPTQPDPLNEPGSPDPPRVLRFPQQPSTSWPNAIDLPSAPGVFRYHPAARRKRVVKIVLDGQQEEIRQPASAGVSQRYSDDTLTSRPSPGPGGEGGGHDPDTTGSPPEDRPSGVPGTNQPGENDRE